MADPRPIVGYRDELERGLRRRGVGRERAGRMADEVAAHLRDRSDELTDGGAGRAEAEAEAVAGFGPARRLAHDLAESAFEGQYTRAARRTVVGCFVYLTAVWIYVRALPGHGLLPGEPATTAVASLTAAAVLGLLIAAAMGRRPQTAALSGLAAAGVAVAFVGAGLSYVPIPGAPPVPLAQLANPMHTPYRWAYEGPGFLRGNYSANLASRHDRREHRERTLLEAGIRTYAAGARASPVPAELRGADGGYIVPRDEGWEGCVNDGDTPAFQPMPTPEAPPKTDAEWRRLLRAQEARPYRTVATWAEAERIWRRVGVPWREAKGRVIARTEHVCAVQEAAMHAPLAFNLPAAVHYGCAVLPPAVLWIGLDWLAAVAGRLGLRIGRRFGRGRFSKA